MKYPAKIAVVASGAAALVAWAVYSRRRRRQLPLEQLSERNSRMHSAESWPFRPHFVQSIAPGKTASKAACDAETAGHSMPRRWSWCPSALVSDTSTPQRGHGTEVGAVHSLARWPIAPHRAQRTVATSGREQ